MRIKADTTAHTPGTIVDDTNDYRRTALGALTIGKNDYQVYEAHYKNIDRTELEMIGPNGAVYFLHTTGYAGVYRAISINTGAAWRRRGNEVWVTALGNVFEAVSPSVIRVSRHAKINY